MKEIKDLVIKTLTSKNMCGFGVDEAQNAKSVQDLINLMLTPKGIEFCMQKGFPKVENLKAYEESLLQNHVVISGKHNISNPRLLLVYGGDVTIEVDGFNVSEVYVTNDAKVNVIAKGGCYIAIENYKDSVVTVEKYDNAKVYRKEEANV